MAYKETGYKLCESEFLERRKRARKFYKSVDSGKFSKYGIIRIFVLDSFWSKPSFNL